VPVTGNEDVNPPKRRWLFNTEHFCVLQERRRYRAGRANRLDNRDLCSIYVVLAVCRRVQAFRGTNRAKLMWILIVYVLIVVVGEAVVVAIGLALDRTLPLASLPVSLSLFFVVLALGWPLAVRWTEPKHAKNVKLAS
jgi:hypothetical protein